MSIKQKILNRFKKFLHENMSDITEDDMEIALYGMEVIYSLLTKTILFFVISIFLGWQIEFFIVSLLLATVRSTSFGFHAEKEINCYIVSFITLFGTIYIAKNYIFDILFIAVLSITSVLATILFAPADTEKRPLLNARIRAVLKICSTISTIFLSLIATFNTGFISSATVCVLLVNTINISPVLYKIFKRRYRNYEYY